MARQSAFISSALLFAVLAIGVCARAESTGCDTDYRSRDAAIHLEVLSSVRHPIPALPNVCKKFSATSVGYDSDKARMFVANPFDAALEIYDISDPNEPTLLKSVFLGKYSGNPDPLHFSRPDHVAIASGVVAVAVINDPVTEPGLVVLLDVDGNIRHELQVGSKPDTLAFTPDSQKIIIVNQGVPNSDYSNDPEASISIIGVPRDDGQPTITTATFDAFNARKEELVAAGVRIYGTCQPSDRQACDADGTATVAQDLEPVFIAFADNNSATAWLTFETNNALAKLDINEATITDIWSFGRKDHSHRGNKFDATSNGQYQLANWPVLGMYQPNGIDFFQSRGRPYLITANRGNWREHEGFLEQTTVGEACRAGLLDSDLCYRQPFNGIAGIANGISDLKIARYPFRYSGDPAATLGAPYSFGGRSFAIWSPDGKLVHDSGADLEKITHEACPSFFNSQSDRNTFDDRSNDKGPEPENVTVAKIEGRQYAFVTLRRIGGMFVYDISDPHTPKFQQYINNRDFEADPKELPSIPPFDNTEFFVNCASKDLQAVYALFVSGRNSPTGEPLLFVVNNFSGSTTIYRVRLQDGHNKRRSFDRERPQVD